MKERDSSMELLRIVSMSMILVWHFVNHGWDYYGSAVLVKPFALSFLFGGVNIFVMISGYFGIKVRLKGFFNLFSLAVVYILINIMLCQLTGIPQNYVDVVKRLVFPFSCGGYWFLAAYIGLYFTAPFLNRGLENMTLPEIRSTLLLFALFNMISGGMLGNMCNPNGFTYLQFVFLYVIGYWMRIEEFPGWSAARFLLLAFAIGMVEFLLITLIQSVFNHSSGYFLRYNNLFVILQSICIIGGFSRLHLKNRLINSIAAASLGCYLLQDGVFGYKILYPFLRSHDEVMNYVLTFIAIWVISFVGLQIKRTCLDPIISHISNIPYIRKI